MQPPSAWLSGMDVEVHPMASPPDAESAGHGVELANLAVRRASEVRVEENRRKSLVRMSQNYRGITLQEPEVIRR